MSKETIKLNISGMTCVNCSNGIEKAVNKLDGLISSKVSFTLNEGEFEIENKLLNKEILINKIQKLGYSVEENHKALEEAKLLTYKKLKYNFLTSITFTIILLYFAFFPLQNNSINQYIMFFLATIVQFYNGRKFYVLAYKAVINRNYDMNVLVALGTSAAYFYSVFVVFFPHFFPENLRFLYFDGAAVIISFILLGKLLEERSKAKATDFLQKLMDLAPLNATLICEDGSLKTVLASELKIGNKVLIKTGEKISTDAIIIKGDADIDTSMITGEYLPVHKTVGNEVIAGTLNTNGIIEVQVIKESKDTTL